MWEGEHGAIQRENRDVGNGNKCELCSSDHPKTSMIAAPIYYFALHFPAQRAHATRAKQDTRASRDAEPERESRGA